MLEPREADMTLDRQTAIIVEPSIEPISLSEVKEFARIDGDDENTLIEGFITSVRKACELWLGRALIEQTIRISFSEWNKGVIELPCPPLISVSSVDTLDESDVATTYDSTNYYVITEAIPGKLVIKNSSALPSNTERFTGGYRVTFKAGYGTTASSVPAPIREALKLWVTWVWENRNLTPDPPPEAKVILSLYRVVRL